MPSGNRFARLPIVMALLLIGAAGSVAQDLPLRAKPRKFDLHEIALFGIGSAANPFDTIATVTFTPSTGAAHAVTVQAFHDGGSTWRARLYVSEPGPWSWRSHCATDSGLDGKSGTFIAEDSPLRGRLLVHPRNPRQWMTEDGRWFLNLNDTAYSLLSTHDAKGKPVPFDDFTAYVRDAVANGITSFRSMVTSSERGHIDARHTDRHNWFSYFADESLDRLRPEAFHECERRLRWLTENFPDVYMQLIVFPRGSRWREDEDFWVAMNGPQKERILRYVVARLAAFPQIFWLIVNDAHYADDVLRQATADVAGARMSVSFANNIALAREAGAYIAQHDPWRHPLSTGHARTVPFHFGRESWATYVHLEEIFDVGAQACARHHDLAKPIFLGEDRYEQDRPEFDPVHMRYFQRRLFWAWLLAGGSANYGGRWWVLHPYAQTGQRSAANPWSAKVPVHTAALTGLDSVRVLRDYFAARRIELSDFAPDHALARDADGRTGTRSPLLMRRQPAEFLVYHPNASVEGRETRADETKVARLQLDLTAAPGRFDVEWFRALDGETRRTDPVEGGRALELTAPWKGCDVAVRLLRQ